MLIVLKREPRRDRGPLEHGSIWEVSSGARGALRCQTGKILGGPCCFACTISLDELSNSDGGGLVAIKYLIRLSPDFNFTCSIMTRDDCTMLT